MNTLQTLRKGEKHSHSELTFLKFCNSPRFFWKKENRNDLTLEVRAEEEDIQPAAASAT